MKKIKLIPALALVAMLSACGTSKISKPSASKAPKLASVGEKIEFATFADEVQKGMGAYSSEEGAVPSYKAKLDEYADSKLKIMNGKQNLLSINEIEKQKNTISADMNNCVAEGKGKQESYMKGSRAEQNTKAEYYQGYEQDAVLQLSTIGETTGIYQFDNLAGTYMLGQDVSSLEEAQRKERFSYIASQSGANVIEYEFFMLIGNYATMDEEEQKLYSFHKNGLVYTVVYENSGTEDVKDDESGEVLYKHTFDESNKMQLDLTKGADSTFSYKKVEKGNFKYEAVKDCKVHSYSLAAGQVMTDESVQYVNNSIESDDSIVVKAVDPAKYSYMESML